MMSIKISNWWIIAITLIILAGCMINYIIQDIKDHTTPIANEFPPHEYCYIA